MATKTVKIKFDNASAAEYFMTWLSEMGEQDYWEWMGIAETEQDGDVTAVSFDYDWDKFAVRAECGRLDDNESDDEEEEETADLYDVFNPDDGELDDESPLADTDDFGSDDE